MYKRQVLGVTALGSSLAGARDRVYTAVEAIDWPGGFYRRDIARRALTGDTIPSAD
jgi:phosphoribosylamine--glycine ligase